MNYKQTILIALGAAVMATSAQAAVSFDLSNPVASIKGDIYNRSKTPITTTTTDSGFASSIIAGDFSTPFNVTLDPNNHFKRVIYKNANGAGCIFEFYYFASGNLNWMNITHPYIEVETRELNSNSYCDADQSLDFVSLAAEIRD